MNIVAIYSFNNGEEFIRNKYAESFDEIEQVINSIDALQCKTKDSKEKTMPEKMLFSPVCLNKEFKYHFSKYGWTNHKEECEYVYGKYLPGYIPLRINLQ